MNQIFHIVRKDFRHNWPAILISVGVVIAFVVDQPRHWTNQTLHNIVFNRVLEAMPFFIILSWAFVIARIVQDETLVGDRQFWITRPYEWHKLLAAKLISIVLFLHLPLFVAQLVLLKMASFPVLRSIPGLLLIHLLFAVLIVMSVLVLASITSGVGQAALALLIVFLIMGGIAALDSYLPNNDLTDFASGINVILYVLGAVSVILFQYLYRRAFFARLIVLGTIALIVLVLVATSYSHLTENSFPLPTKDHPLPAQLFFDKTLSFQASDGKNPGFRTDTVQLEFPFQLKEFAGNTILQIKGVKLDLEMPNGERWSSRWENHSDDVVSGRSRMWPSINMKRELFDRIKNGPVSARLSLAIAVYDLGTGSNLPMKDGHLSLPGGGRCMNDMSEDALHCFAAVNGPKRFFIMADLPGPSCHIMQEQAMLPWAVSPAAYMNLSTGDSPDASFSPVVKFDITLRRSHGYEDQEIKLPICAGTSLLASRPEFRYRIRTEIDLGDIVLQRYRPTYPRIIIPPLDHHTLTPQDNTLSFNFWKPLLGPLRY